MVKTLAFIARREDIERDAFRDHYESVHSPLALPILDGLERYLRHHVRRELEGTPFFDCVTSFWWRDGTALNALLSRLDGPEGAAVRADELTFMRKEANRSFGVQERVLRRSASRGRMDRLVLAKRPDDMTLDEFLTDYERHLVARLKGLGAPGDCIQNRGLSFAGQEAAFDCVTCFGFEGSGSESRHSDQADRWAREFTRPLLASGAQLLVLAVSEHETEIG